MRLQHFDARDDACFEAAVDSRQVERVVRYIAMAPAETVEREMRRSAREELTRFMMVACDAGPKQKKEIAMWVALAMRIVMKKGAREGSEEEAVVRETRRQYAGIL